MADEPISEPTLDDVYSEFNVSEQAQDFNNQVETPVPEQDFTAPVVPDPTFDPDGYKNYMTNLSTSQNRMSEQFNQQISSVQNELTTLRQERVQEQSEKDLNAAVDTLANHAEGVDRELLKGALFAKANGDPRFLNIWEGRGSNPQAFGKALAALGREVSSKVPTIDPEVAESQRALREATQSERSTTSNSAETEFDSLSDSDFMAQMKSVERG